MGMSVDRVKCLSKAAMAAEFIAPSFFNKGVTVLMDAAANVYPSTKVTLSQIPAFCITHCMMLGVRGQSNSRLFFKAKCLLSGLSCAETWLVGKNVSSCSQIIFSQVFSTQVSIVNYI